LFAALLIAERPSALQLAGTAAILAGLVIASASRRQRPTTEQVAEAPAG
jgi:drug/metabolite transporter (DMT)-like permease